MKNLIFSLTKAVLFYFSLCSRVKIILKTVYHSHFVRTMEMKNAFVAGLPRSTQVNSLMFYELYLILYTVVWKLLYTVFFFFFVMFDCWYDVLFMKCCVGFTSDVTGHTFQKVQLLSHQSTEYLPKSLWDNQDIFWQMWDEPLCSFWSVVAFALELFLILESWTRP